MSFIVFCPLLLTSCHSLFAFILFSLRGLVLDSRWFSLSSFFFFECRYSFFVFSLLIFKFSCLNFSIKPLRLEAFSTLLLMISGVFFLSDSFYCWSLFCDLVKTFHLWRLACPDFLTYILSLWKNYAHLTSVSHVVSEFLFLPLYHFSPPSIPSL